MFFQLGRIYLDMLNVYKVMSENISSAIATNGESVTKQPLIRSMRTVKKETLKLISGWVSRSNDPQMVAENFILPLLDAVLLDYQRNVPAAREPEVLSTMATIVNRLEVRPVVQEAHLMQWGTVHMQRFTSPLHRTQSYRKTILSLKQGVGHDIALHGLPSAGNFAILISAFTVHSTFFMCVCFQVLYSESLLYVRWWIVFP